MVTATRGEIWFVDLNPGLGSEIKKDRPVVVVSVPAFDATGVRIVVPLTGWQEKFERRINMVRVPRTLRNGLDKDDAADVLQVRCVALERFGPRVGPLEADVLEEILAGIVIAIGYAPPGNG